MGRNKKADKRVVVNTDYDPDVLQMVVDESMVLECSKHDTVNRALRYYFDNCAGLDQLSREKKALTERLLSIQRVMDKWQDTPATASHEYELIHDYLVTRIGEAAEKKTELQRFSIYDTMFKKDLLLFLTNLGDSGITPQFGYKLAKVAWKEIWDEINEKKNTGKKMV